MQIRFDHIVSSITRAARPSLLAAALAAVAACGGETTATEQGYLQVQLTDAPFPYAEVSRVDAWVVRIDAKREDADSAEVASDVDDADELRRAGGWVTIAVPNRRIELLALRNGVTTNLGADSLPTGRYRSFRLVLNTDSSSVTLKDGTVLSGANGGIKFPSAHRSGIKVQLAQPIDVTANGTVMVLDFDVSKSFVLRGNSLKNNGLLFKPVVRATARDVTGSVSGVVKQDSAGGAVAANALVQVLAPGTALTDTVSANVVAASVTDAAGAFKVAFLLPGTYQVRAIGAAGSGYGQALLAGGVTIASGTDAGAKVIVMPKQ